MEARVYRDIRGMQDSCGQLSFHWRDCPKGEAATPVNINPIYHEKK